MATKFCAIGCPPGKNYYIFPSSVKEEDRRKLWLNFFDMDEPYQRHVYACERHFSHFQTNRQGLKKDAVPDIPVVYYSSNTPFRRKLRDLRKNVIVVTPRDPEFMIYRNQTGVFHQNLFNFANSQLSPPSMQSTKPLVPVPIIKTVSCSMLTQTNTRLCGSVQISEFLDEFRLNCFYCSKTFLLPNWSEFVKHLKDKHFEEEEAFKKCKYLSKDHDYTPVKSPPSSPLKKKINSHILSEPIVVVPPPLIIDLTDGNTLQPKISPPPPTPSPSIPKPAAAEKTNDGNLNLNLAKKLIKLLDETVLNPDFRRTDEDNIVIIKRKVVETQQSNFLSKIITEEARPSTSSASASLANMPVNKKPQTTSSNVTVSKFTRPLYTINYGQQNVVSVRSTPKVVLKKYVKKRRPTIMESEPPAAVQDIDADVEENPVISSLEQPNIPKRSKSFVKRIARQAIKNITTFENVYQTVKIRDQKLPKEISSGIFYVKDINSNKVTEMQTEGKTPLSRCLRRASGIESVYTPVSIETPQENQVEIVFEYSPENVINSLLDNMKDFPVLWEFHDHPYNQNYTSAIAELCKIMNTKWSLNINPLKMRSSINRILRFYRYMLPCEYIDKFIDYFEKCTHFLPSSVEEIPRARCLHCYICYGKDSELRQHLIEKHQFLKWPFKCDHCPERFLEASAYELHKSLPHYVEIFKCEECGKRFNRKGLYNKHKSSTHDRTTLRCLDETTENAEKVNDTVKYVCNICHKEYKSASKLKHHNIFHGEKRFKCHLCPKAFFLKSYLKVHIMRHKNELNYICEICGRSFLRSAHLNRHRATHTGEQVTCNICNIKLSQGSLSRHRRLVHLALEGTLESTYRAKSHRHNSFMKPRTVLNRTKETGPRHYNCKICQLPFDRLKFLKEHNQQMHANVERKSCKICNVIFRHRQNLKTHYREKHKLHIYQIHKLVDKDEKLEDVMAIKQEELDALYQYAQGTEKRNISADVGHSMSTSDAVNYFDQDKIHSNALQDEIMKAVEHIDKQEIRIDDEHSMHEFFNNLLKNP